MWGTIMIAINVAQLLKSAPGTTRTFEFREDEPELAAEITLRRPIEGHARLMRTSRGILVQADYQTVVELACSRCLEQVEVPIEGHLEDEFLPTVDVTTGVPLEVGEESEELRIGEKHVLDLTEAIRQDLLVRQPLQPLCREACAGLCPQCGTNLNVRQCDCVLPGERQTALSAALRELLEQEERL